ncbi:MMPL family transporter [Streptomyces sp. 6N223]|uniref:MMPL family transporter n=1 Tax=Streptomyces sp. 6N223 TaxID=3457412 RepID=UPI003FD47F6A
MFTWLGRLAFRRARLLLIITGLVVAVAGVLATGAMERLKVGGFLDPEAPSTEAAELIDSQFGGQANIVFLVEATEGAGEGAGEDAGEGSGGGSVDSPAVREAGERLTERLAAEPELSNVVSYWSTGARALKSTDDRYAVVTAHVAGDEHEALEHTQDLHDEYEGSLGAAEVTFGGWQGVNRDIFENVMTSLAIAEAIAVPLTLILLLAAFGSVVAATLPLAIGLLAIVGTFGLLSVLGSVTDVSIFSANLTTALGLGLGIDYALLIVARYRERLTAGDSVEDALVNTVRTAGRTIVFSAAIVAASLATMLLFPLYFLRSFAYAGIGVVTIAALAALFVVPALLALLGHRINAGKLPWVTGIRGGDAPFWGRLARGVARRPLLAVLPVAAVLLVAASPLLGVQFGTPDERVLRDDVASREVSTTLREDFEGFDDSAIEVVTTTGLSDEALADLATRISERPGVVQVETSGGVYASGQAVPGARPAAERGSDDAEWLTVATDLTPKSDEATDLVRDLRAMEVNAGDPGGGEATTLLVGGTDAELIDTRDAIGSRLALALAVIVLITFLVLFLFTGSVVQPLRALLLNGLGLVATLGAMVWVFQEGHLSGLLGFTPQPTDSAMSVLIFCVVFGLAMDYEVFVIARIKEMHDAGLGDREAVEQGLSRTGRIVSTAAGLLAVSFLAFGTSSINFVQMFGLGAGLAILLDAVLIRGVLVPGSLALLGRAAWWLPGPLKPVHARLGLSEAPEEAAPPPAPAAGSGDAGPPKRPVASGRR